MGFSEPCFRETAKEMIGQALDLGPDGHSRNPGMEHITLDALKKDGRAPLALHSGPQPFLPFASGSVPTPSRKIEFYSEKLSAEGLDPLPGFKPPVESRWGEAALKYPLELLGRKNDNYLNSSFANLPGHRKMEARSDRRLEMHPSDAEVRAIREGDTVRVYNDRGTVELKALLNPHLPAGVVAARLDWAKFHPDFMNINALTSERLTDIGAGATFYSTLVEVAPA